MLYNGGKSHLQEERTKHCLSHTAEYSHRQNKTRGLIFLALVFTLGPAGSPSNSYFSLCSNESKEGIRFCLTAFVVIFN